MELLHGAPVNTEGRQDREIRAYKLLEEAGVDFLRTDHPDEPATSMEVCEKVDAVLEVRICKNLFLCNRQKTNFYLLVMPGEKPLRQKSSPGSSESADCRSRIRNIWRSIWTFSQEACLCLVL